MTLAGFAAAQTPYRDANPLVDANSLSNLSINLNVYDATDAQLQQIVDAGFKFVRWDLWWEGTEPKKGLYDWRVADRLMARAKAKGLRVMMLLAYGNPLYTSDTGAPNTPVSRAAYARYAAAAAARYAHQGVIWEIYNEPNLPGWWANPNAADYAALVNATADAIRGVSADEWIIGLTTEMIRSDNRAYLTQVLSTPGVLAKLDGVGIHPYTTSAPETTAAGWAEVRSLIESKRPADHPVALLAGEQGYLRNWTGITPEVQATYNVRAALFNLTQGIGFTNLFSYNDSVAGITSYVGNNPYPAYYALQRMTQGLQGYQFSKRLDMGRADDYCLLFNNPSDPSDTKLVCWTTGAPHTMKVPSSAVSFVPTDLSSAATFVSLKGAAPRAMAASTITATSAGLSVPTTNDALLLDSQGPNPLLSLAAAWDKLPSSLTFSTKADAIKQIGAIVASPAWSAMPAGATLRIEDKPKAVNGYNRVSYVTTLTNLSSLKVDSVQTQALFNSLPSLQDEMDVVRTLKITVALPDGTAVSQTATVVRKQPMSLLPVTPSNWKATLRIENPSGQPFDGIVKVTSGAATEVQAVKLGRGETYRIIPFTTLPIPTTGGDIRYSLYDNGANVSDPGSPVLESTAQTVYRAPALNVANFTVKTYGDAKVAGTASLKDGVADWLFLTGTLTGNITYSFAPGWKYANLTGPAAFNSQTFAKPPLSVGLYFKGDGSRNVLRAQFVDSTGQTFQATYGQIDWTGWKWVSIPLNGTWTGFWGGANDGVVHGAMRCLVPLTLDSSGAGSAGQISITGFTIIGQK